MKKNIFQLPEGYFETFNDRLKARLDEGESDLEQSEHLKQSVFQVPEGYFEAFEDRLRTRLDEGEGKLEQSEYMKEPVFEVPEGYFDQLEDRIKGRMAEENSVLSKQTRLKEPVFEVPEGYFESFPGKLQDRIKAEEEEAKVIPLYQKNWFRMAVAAVLVIGFFLLRPDTGNELLSDETMFAYLSETDGDLDLMASLDGFDTAIDEILVEETAGYDFDMELNPELDYEFEYLEQ